jgi:hypothetical protein
MNAKNIVEQNELLELTDKELEGVCGGQGAYWYPPTKFTYTYQAANASGYASGNNSNNSSTGNGSSSSADGNGGTASNSNG